MYDDAMYADSRLRNTIVRLKDGTPITITSTEGGRGDMIKFYYETLSGSREDTVYIKDLDLEPVPLGFCNMGRNGLAFITRMPMQRDWRQGMRMSNVRSLYGNDHRHATNAQLHKTIVGDFPTFPTAYNKCLNGGVSTAFHRNFATRVNEENPGTVDLIYKWYGKVGDIISGKVSLDKNWLHLTNPVEEVIT